MIRFAFRKSLLLSAALLASGALSGVAASSAHAQANITFTGGNGAPLSFTLADPVTYTVTGASSQLDFIFRTQEPSGNFSSLGTSSITYSVNGGSPFTINTLQKGVAFGVVIPTDTFVYGTDTTINVGDTVVLTAGTFTTNSNFTQAPPPSGSFLTFIENNLGSQVSTFGVAGTAATAVPEPSEYAMAGMFGATLLFGMVRARRKKVSATA